MLVWRLTLYQKEGVLLIFYTKESEPPVNKGFLAAAAANKLTLRILERGNRYENKNVVLRSRNSSTENRMPDGDCDDRYVCSDVPGRLENRVISIGTGRHSVDLNICGGASGGG